MSITHAIKLNYDIIIKVKIIHKSLRTVNIVIKGGDLIIFQEPSFFGCRCQWRKNEERNSYSTAD